MLDRDIGYCPEDALQVNFVIAARRLARATLGFEVQVIALRRTRRPVVIERSLLMAADRAEAVRRLEGDLVVATHGQRVIRHAPYPVPVC